MDTDRQAAAPQPTPQPQANIAAVAAPSYTIDTYGRIIFIVVVVEIIILFGLNLYQKSRIKDLGNQLAAKQATLQSAQYKTLNDQVNQVLSGNAQLQMVLNGKVNWTKFYAQLNAVTPKNVQLTTLSIAQNGSFKADGKTTTLDSLAKAMVAWEQGVGTTPSPFAAVSLSSEGFTATGGNRQVGFSISGQINLGGLK